MLSAGMTTGLRPTLLLVDDDADFLDSLSDLLAADYRILTARDGASAMRALSTSPIDLVVLDIHMPDPNGWAVFSWMRREPRLKFTPVLIFSTHPAPLELGEQINAEAPCWLAKDVDPARLQAAIRKHLSPAPL